SEEDSTVTSINDTRTEPTTSLSTQVASSNNNNNNNDRKGEGDNDSLYQLFTYGQKIWSDLQTSSAPSTNDPDYQSSVKSALLFFMKASMAIDRQALFSKNEEIDDIRTDLLKYLLVPYYMSELFQQQVDVDRIKNLKRSKANRRNELINRGKREKEIKQKLSYIISKRMALIKAQGNKDGFDDEAGDCGDEEVEREFAMLLLNDAIVKTVAMLEMMDSELTMLEEIDKIKSANNGVVPKPPPPKPSNIGNFQILPDGRQIMLDKVFRPSHILPTISPEQAALWEMQNGGMAQGPGGEASKKKEDDDEDQDDGKEEDLAKLKKTRDWDDWKDDNPRGWGNL
ncbi:hypothetical protein SAMD00019534_039970, partial [Acytostelium subglobosum LB1]|uniref:hypothetical protein n=1 Tax=Acytostelium subglobosum LB1 TaxID=1410327 RepID=UPI000645099F